METSTELGIMRRQKTRFQTKENKMSEKELNEVEISYQPNKKSKVMAIKLLIKHGRKMDKHSENFNKNKRKFQSEVKNNRNKNTL